MFNTRRFTSIIYLAIPIIFFISLFLGSYQISPSNLLKILIYQGKNAEENLVIWQIRLPRLLLAIFAGAGLAVASSIFQSIFRNRLADPAIIGISSAAACGAVIASSFSVIAGSILPSTLLSLSITWATIFILFTLESRSKINQALIILGVSINALFTGLIAAFSQINSSPQVRSFTSWSMGTLATVTWSDFYIVLCGTTIGIAVLVVISRKLDLFFISDVEIRALGENPSKVKTIAALAAGAMVALASSTLGVISFIGLLVPNIVKAAGIYLHRESIYIIAGLGAILLLISDTLARTLISNLELPVSIFLVLIGVPFLITMLLSKRVL